MGTELIPYIVGGVAVSWLAGLALSGYEHRRRGAWRRVAAERRQRWEATQAAASGFDDALNGR